MAEKKITKKSPSRTVKKEIKEEIVVSPVEEIKTDSCCLNRKPLKKVVLFLVFLVILAGVLGYFFKDKFLVAIVDNKPIFRYTLSQYLVKSSGKDALENLIVEQLIEDEIKRNNISIVEEDIEAEINKIKGQLGETVNLDEVLKMQGMTTEEFREQIKTRLKVYKLLDKDVSVSTEEVAQYLTENAEFLKESTEEGKVAEATQMLKEQKINEKIQAWISGLLEKAKITRFLE